MDTKIETSLDIGPDDIGFVRQYLKGKTQPVDFADIVYQVALFKTRDGNGVGVRLGFTFDSRSLRLQEHGPIRPEETAKRSRP